MGYDKVPFAKIPRRLIPIRIETDWGPRYREPDADHIHDQAHRCSDCGIPFCEHACPLGNEIPDFNRETKLAIDRSRQNPYDEHSFDQMVATLEHTNNFPEWTGTMCPAPCEDACVHAIEGGEGEDKGAWGAVTIKDIEHFIADELFERGLRPRGIESSTGKSIAVIGSGPAGLAAAQQLTRSGHSVIVIERDDAIGGLIRYGIPDFKFDKRLLDKRLLQMEQEGTRFVTSHEISRPDQLSAYNAVVIATGMRQPRDLDVPGRELGGVVGAMDYLTAQNRALQSRFISSDISAEGKTVVVLGGGDTGDDCVGVALRQGADRVLQFTHGSRPPLERLPNNPWPLPKQVWKARPSLDELDLRGGIEFNAQAFALYGDDDGVQEVHVRQPSSDGGDSKRVTRVYKSNLVVIATGFRGVDASIVASLDLQRTPEGKIWRDDNFRAYSPVLRNTGPALFVGGDAARGASLIVWAIAEGRSVAGAVDKHLMGRTALPQPLDAGQTLSRMT